MNEPYAIQDLIDVQELAQIQDCMAKAIGFAAVITDTEGKPITHLSNFSKACEMFHRPLAGTLCEASDKTLGKESLEQGGVVIRQCDHAGLMDAAVSITLDGRPIGIFLCGQVFFKPPKEELYRQKAKELGIDEEAYLKAIKEVPIVPKERFEAGVELMRQTARMLAEAGRKSLEHQKAIEALEHAQAKMELLLSLSPLGICEWRPGGELIDFNEQYAAIVGYTKEEVFQMGWKNLTPPEYKEFENEQVEELFKKGKNYYRKEYTHKDGHRVPIYLFNQAILKQDGTPDYIISYIQDITEIKNAQAKLEELVEAQQRTIKELSTPVIPVWSRVIMAPLLGSFDSVRMHDLSERLLEEVAYKKPRAVLLDLSGLAFVDTQVVSEILRLVTSVRLLGARTILSGIGPTVAQSLVRLGANLDGIATYATLEQALRNVVGEVGHARR